MSATNFQTIALIPLDSDNTNRIATMRNIQNLSSSLTTSFGSYGGRITTLETNYSSLSSTVSSHTASISSFSSSISTLQGQMTTAQNNISTAQTNISTLQGQMSTANTNVSTLQGQMTTANTNISTAQSNISTLQSKVRYDVGIFSSGTCTANERIFDFVAPVAFSLATNLSGSIANARTAPVSAFVLTLRKNGTSIGTINFAASAITGTFSVTATSFVAGDRIDILAQSATDALADISITLVGSR